MPGGKAPRPKASNYYVGIHFVLCHGPIDKITEIQISEKEAWAGTTTGGKITINKEELFGGLTREGGVSGDIDIEFGEPTQGKNAYLQSVIGTNIPNFKGVVSAILNKVHLGTNYYLKPWLFKGTRIHKRRNGVVQWQDGLAEPVPDLINAVHVIRECLTDLTWGRGLSDNLIDETSFLASAQTCYNEGLGFSWLWTQEKSIEGFITDVLKHIQGSLYLDRKDGTFHLNLIRKINDPSSLTLLDETNIVAVKDFNRRSVGDLISSITVKYIDNTTNKKNTVTAVDNALYARQGAPVSKTITYSGVATTDIAQRLAIRDVQQSSTPLYTCTILCNRDAENLNVGDAFRLNWPDYVDGTIVMRVISINLGTVTKPTISIECIQDIFNAPDVIYSSLPGTAWTDPISDPLDAPYALLDEVPYYSVALLKGDSFAQSIDPTETYMIGTLVKPTPDSISTEMWTTTGTNYEFRVTAFFCFSATLQSGINRQTTTVPIENVTNLSLTAVGEFIQIDSEFMEVVAISGTSITVNRGILDTIPEVHLTGSRVWGVGNNGVSDEITYLIGETPKVKFLPTTAKGSLDISLATEHSITLVGRLHKPYPPANVQLNGSYFPASFVKGTGITVTWATRNRIQQTAGYVDWFSGNVTSEAGVVYDLRLYRTDTQADLVTATGVTGTSSLLSSDYLGQVALEIKANRLGELSYQTFKHIFDFTFAPFVANFSISNYTVKRTITISSSLIDADLLDFPVLVKLDATNFNFTSSSSNGSDIRFTLTDGITVLAYERERHDSVNNVAEYWVKLPSISSTSDTSFYMYYTTTTLTDGQNVEWVWDNNYLGVWHLGDSPTRIDSTINNNDGTSSGGVSTATGQIANATLFNGINSHIDTGTGINLANKDFTISFLVKRERTGLLELVVGQGTPSTNIGLHIGFRTNDTFGFGFYGNDLYTTTTYTDITNIHLWTATYNATTKSRNLYFDGTLVANDTASANFQGTGTFFIGRSFDGYNLQGLMDEARVAGVVRSSAWIKASYHSENNTLLTIGAEIPV